MGVDDRYTYPGSGGVLINKLDLHDPDELDRALNDHASLEWEGLLRDPIPPSPGFDYLAGIHRRLFSQVLPFASEFRDVDVQAVGTGIPYCRPDYIRPELNRLFAQLQREDFLAGVPRQEFPELLAERWGDLSAIHPFRDGNTRSQSLYVSRLTERAGFTLDWRAIDVDELRDRRLMAVAGRIRPLAEYLDHALS